MTRKKSRPKFESWGRYPSMPASVIPLHWPGDFPLHPVNDEPSLVDGESTAAASSLPKMLPVGMGRSYGDSCLLRDGTLLSTRGLDRFQSMDDSSGVLRCEAGVTLGEILQFSIPRGWFLPVVPGTRHITVGGAIANDIHGKNHYSAGTFGRYVRGLQLARSDGSQFVCSPERNMEWFGATVAGLGLTGLIVSAELQLRPIVSPVVNCETTQFHGIDEFLALSVARQSSEYSYAWMDSTASGGDFARGVFLNASHLQEPAVLTPRKPSSSYNLPFDLPGFVLNRASVGVYNALYFHRHRARPRPRLLRYDSFLFSQDRIQHWNRLYGKRGFVQFHCVLPLGEDRQAPLQLLKAISAARLTSFFTLLQLFGNAASPGILSFPMPGISLSFDFPNRGEDTLDLLQKLARITAEHGGRIYPAKDTQMTATEFQGFYPRWEEFAAFVDPAFSSSFWERVTARD